MNRRNFFSVMPIGLVGVASVAMGNQPEPETIVAAESMIIRHNNKDYNVLAVPVKSTQFEKLPVTKTSDVLYPFLINNKEK